MFKGVVKGEAFSNAGSRFAVEECAFEYSQGFITSWNDSRLQFQSKCMQCRLLDISALVFGRRAIADVAEYSIGY
jgi:hypothetical protein